MEGNDSLSCRSSVVDLWRSCSMEDDQARLFLMELLTAMADRCDYKKHMQLLKELVLRYSVAERSLAELNQLKNKFLGMAAHDLRNPLAAVRGFAELLLEEGADPLTDEQRELLGMMHRVVVEMQSLVNDLLDVSVIESGRLDLNRARAPMRAVVEERVQVNRFAAERKGMRIHLSIEGNPVVVFDKKRIAQVIDNLIGNAVKFSPVGSTVHVELKEEGGRVRLSVRDEGPGLTPEDRQKLFGEFQKLSARPTGSEGSTGLGLAIVKKIIDAHGGLLQVESSPGRGATFGFSLASGGEP